jgi:FtsZ-binding cell division protein ZapB
MKIPVKYTIALKIFLPVIFLSFPVILGVTHNNWGKTTRLLNTEIDTYKLANSTLTESVKESNHENELLKQAIAVMQREVEDWKSYIDSLSAQVVYVPEYHEQTITKEQTIIKEVEVSKPVYVNNEWREFESPAVLMSWAKEHLANLWIVGNKVADCDDYASRLQLEAFKDGYLLSVQLIKNGLLYDKNVSNYVEAHMGNLAMIGNEIYFIEPQPDFFRIVFVCNRD